MTYTSRIEVGYGRRLRPGLSATTARRALYLVALIGAIGCGSRSEIDVETPDASESEPPDVAPPMKCGCHTPEPSGAGVQAPVRWSDHRMV